MTNLQKLTALIVEAVPSIMELKFGCVIEVDGIAQDNPGWEKDIVIDDRIEDGIVRTGYYGRVHIDNLTILGRDINLEDVMIAWSEKTKFSAKLYSISNNGGYYENGKLLWKWELGNPLSSQSEETINKLLMLLQ